MTNDATSMQAVGLQSAALAYTQRLAWPIFPLKPGRKVPLPGSNGFKDASTDPGQIRTWWARCPEANIGLACGAAGLVVIDLDLKAGVDGLAAWRELKAILVARSEGRAALDDNTVASRTPSGGLHLFFRCPQGARIGNSSGKLGPGIDVRGSGGYVVLPPSVSRDGRRYGWERGAGPYDRPILILPREVAARLASSHQHQSQACQPCSSTEAALTRRPGPLPGQLEDLPWDARGGGERRPTADRLDGAFDTHAYARAAVRSELDELSRTPEGQRNDRLNRAAFNLGQLLAGGGLDRSVVEDELLQVALAAGLGRREAQATIRSGLHAGQKHPRQISVLGLTGGGRHRGSAARQKLCPPSETGETLLPSSQVLAATIQPPGPAPGVPTGDQRPRLAARGQLAAELGPPLLPEAARLPKELGQGACRWLDDYVAFSRKWSPRSFDGFHEACGLWLLSTIAARRVVLHFGNRRYTNLYLMLAGRTTMHAKSSVTDIARQTLSVCGLNYLLAPDEATPQSFLRALAGGDLPQGLERLEPEQRQAAKMRLAFCGQRGWYAEEFGSWLAAMLRSDGVMADFRGLLRKFDDCPPDYTRSTIARGMEQVERPYLALIANLTPADLRPVARRGAQLWGDGFLARFAFVTPPRDEVLTARFPEGERRIGAELSQPLVEWHQRLGLPDVQIDRQVGEDGRQTDEYIVTVDIPEPQTCVLGDGVRDALYRYNEALLEISRDSELTDLDGNYGRFHEKALRVAALLASLENEGRIGMQHWARAQEIAERWRLYTHRLYAQVTQAPPSAQREIEDRILDVVRRWQGKGKYQEGMTANDIRRFCWRLRGSEVKPHLDQLVAAGALLQHKIKRAERYRLPHPGDDAGHTGEAQQTT